MKNEPIELLREIRRHNSSGLTKDMQGRIDAALSQLAEQQPEQSGLVGQVCGGDSQHNTVNVAVVGTVPWNDLPLGTPVRLIPAQALPAQGGDA